MPIIPVGPILLKNERWQPKGRIRDRSGRYGPQDQFSRAEMRVLTVFHAAKFRELVVVARPGSLLLYKIQVARSTFSGGVVSLNPS